MHKLPFPLSTPAALAACLLAPPALHAQADPATKPATNLPPIIVQASRTGRTAAEMPANVQVITSDEIARSGHQNVVDVLQKQAGVYIRDLSGNPANAQISMRGFGANSHGRVLILVNGERINNPDMSSPNLLRIPVQSVKRIEVLHGSQTVLYGDYAEAGVINIITDTSADTKPETTLATSVGSYDTYAAHLSKSGTFEDGVSYFAAADWNKSDGYRDNSNYESFNLDASVTKHWDDVRSFSVSTFYHDSSYGLPGSLNGHDFKSNPKKSTTPKDDSQLETWGVNLGGSTKLGEDGRLEANFTVSRRETDTRFVSLHSYRGSAVDSYAFTPRYILDSDIAGHANRLTIGTDVRLDQASINDNGKVWDFDRTSLAGYASDEFFLTEDLSLTLGARTERFFNRVSHRAGSESYQETEHAFDAALLYRPQEYIKLFARTASYYHAPFVDESVGWGGGAPNTDLVPETGYTLETGAELLLAKEWTLAATVYQTDTKNEIYYDPKAKTWGANINAPDDTRRQGAETALRWIREDVASASLNYDYVHAFFTEGQYDNNTFPMVPRHTLTLNGEFYATHEVALLGGVRYVASQYLDSDLANKQEQLKAYGLLDLAVRYEPGCLKGLRLLAGVDNVCDKEYASYGGYSTWSGNYYYPANTRTWKVCASYTF